MDLENLEIWVFFIEIRENSGEKIEKYWNSGKTQGKIYDIYIMSSPTVLTLLYDASFYIKSIAEYMISSIVELEIKKLKSKNFPVGLLEENFQLRVLGFFNVNKAFVCTFFWQRSIIYPDYWFKFILIFSYESVVLANLLVKSFKFSPTMVGNLSF